MHELWQFFVLLHTVVTVNKLVRELWKNFFVIHASNHFLLNCVQDMAIFVPGFKPKDVIWNEITRELWQNFFSHL